MRANPWLLRQAGAARRLRLFCFSYAGGSAAAYLPWQAGLDPSIELCAVELPGRGMRMLEPHQVSLPALVGELAGVIARERDLPFAFFGHSLGGLLAFELARHCMREQLPMPAHLFVSGCAAPRHPDALPGRLHELPDAALIDVLRDYNGTPPAVLAHQELMALVLPTIRADFQLVADYRYRPGMLLDIPLTVMAGTRDERVAQRVAGWRDETTGCYAIEWFEGDHFFIQPQRDAVSARLNAELLGLLDRPAPRAGAAGAAAAG